MLIDIFGNSTKIKNPINLITLNCFFKMSKYTNNIKIISFASLNAWF